ncbi:MAG: alpha/beta fold hydrolase [Chitinophagaceae bacterium]|nr:alpha/beta fold hydrolase [Chitinophagaceae bacterium]
MPLIKSSDYKPPVFIRNRHFLTIYPSLFRNIKSITYARTRVETPDHDFIDLDFSSKGHKRIVILLHGLEGSSNSNSVTGMVNVFNHGSYDTVSVNFRGCSGEPNKELRYYHSGETDDLGFVVKYIHSLNKYNSIHIVGFSMGGNILLKYLGEQSQAAHGIIKSAVALSVPCDLKEGATEMGKKHNIMYMKRFIKELEQKLLIKKDLFPERINLDNYKLVKNFKQFDELYTAPINGFKSAEDYWEKSSSLQFLSRIKVPTLLINALDDPFLGKKCFPYEEARNSEHFFLETPLHGGHVGFMDINNKFYWSERRALAFINEMQ